MRHAVALSVSLGLLALAFGCAGGPDPVPTPSYRCAPATSAITVDGTLDEPAWKAAPGVGLCTATETAAEPPLAVARFCRDEENFYLAVEVRDTNIMADGTARDGVNMAPPNDAVTLLVDVEGDGRHFVRLCANPFGALSDAVLVVPQTAPVPGMRPDVGAIVLAGYDVAGARAAARTYVGDVNHPELPNEKWTVEIAVPFHAMPFRSALDRAAPPATPASTETWQATIAVQNCDLPAGPLLWPASVVTGPLQFARIEFGRAAP